MSFSVWAIFHDSEYLKTFLVKNSGAEYENWMQDNEGPWESNRPISLEDESPWA